MTVRAEVCCGRKNVLSTNKTASFGAVEICPLSSSLTRSLTSPAAPTLALLSHLLCHAVVRTKAVMRSATGLEANLVRKSGDLAGSMAFLVRTPVGIAKRAQLEFMAERRLHQELPDGKQQKSGARERGR
jgi:hypothetical protein